MKTLTTHPATRLLILAMALLFSATALEADGRRTVKRVKFQRGRTTAILKGNIKSGDEMIYVLGAAEGQTMTAHISATARNNDVVFWVTGPNGSIPEEEQDVSTDWSQTLPASGDYQIHIGMIESKKANYTLEVTIR